MRIFPLGALCLLLGLGRAPAADVRILVPLYSYPAWYAPAAYVWDDVAAAAARVPVTAIINPDSGPGGGPPNSDYEHGLAEQRVAGVVLLGYVATGYGARPAADVKAAAAEAAVRAASVVLSQDVKAGQGGALVDRGIADLRKFMH